MLHFPGFTPFEISDILLVCLGGQKLFIPKEGHSPMSTLFLRARTVRSVFSQGYAVGEYVRPSGGGSLLYHWARITPFLKMLQAYIILRIRVQISGASPDVSDARCR